MIGFTKEQLADISEYQGISTEGDLAAFALAQMEQSEADRRELVERGKDIHTLTCALESERLRAENAEAENAKLRKCVKAGDHYINSIYSITSNTGLLHAEWSEKIDYYAARAEVDK